MTETDFYLDEVSLEQGQLFSMITKQKVDLTQFIKLYFEHPIHRGIDENKPRYATMSAEDIYDQVKDLTQDFHEVDSYAAWYGHVYAQLHSDTGIPSDVIASVYTPERLTSMFDPDTDQIVKDIVESSAFIRSDDKNMSIKARGNFRVNGILYTSVYQYLLYRKAEWHKNMSVAKKILSTTDDFKLKMLGSQISTDVKWNSIMGNILYTGAFNFFKQNEVNRNVLKQYKDQLIFYTGLDKCLSIGVPITSVNMQNTNSWKGSNLYGNTLMKVIKTGGV